VTANATEGSTSAHSATRTINITENPVPEAPTLTAGQATAASSSVNEGGAVGLTITPSFESDPDATNTVTITGVPTTATLSAGTNNGGGSWTLTQAQLANLTLTAGDDDVTSITLQVTANATEGSTSAHSATRTINITENPVPEAPTLTAGQATATSASIQKNNGSDGLTIAPTFESDLDATDTVTITIATSGSLNTGKAITLNHGTLNAGTYTLTTTDLTNLTVNTPVNSGLKQNDTITLTVQAHATEGSTPANSVTQTINLTVTNPAGTAGSPINLGLTDPVADPSNPTEVTLAGIPAGWIVNGGTDLGGGTWSVMTVDPSALTVTTPTNFTGAMVLQVKETWTNADGSGGNTYVADNVEAYAPASPIFALSGDDHLTGAGANEMFVFSQPIGHDTIYNFDPSADQIDLIGYAGFTSFVDVQSHTINDGLGDAVITLGDGQSITLHGVDASSLNSNDFVFDQTPVTENPGTMTIGDGAILPLSGIIDNTGTIALNSAGSETDLELIEHGLTLQGHGQVIFSDSAENVITGTVSDVTLTNVDNTISGAGQLGEGQMTLINEGIIDATGTNALVLDTGTNTITNSGILEATGAGGLIVNSAVANSGSLLADGGNLTFNGAVTGSGSATISGAASLEFAGASAESVNFATGSTGTLKLDDSAAFTGSVSGLTTTTYIDLADLSWAQGQMIASFSGDASGGKLTVSDGTQSDTINLAGDYTQSGWTLSQDSNGKTLVVDPPLASAPNAGGAGDRSTMLMAQYAAAGFQSGVGGGAGGYTTTPTPEAVFEPPSLTKPT
jgi:hypothetical protein